MLPYFSSCLDTQLNLFWWHKINMMFSLVTAKTMYHYLSLMKKSSVHWGYKQTMWHYICTWSMDQPHQLPPSHMSHIPLVFLYKPHTVLISYWLRKVFPWQKIAFLSYTVIVFSIAQQILKRIFINHQAECTWG